MTSASEFTVPPLNKRRRIPIRTIRAIAKHIAENFQPEEIILFGSHAHGKPQLWSDVDLLVVMDTPKGEIETSIEIYESLPQITFGLDIIVRSRKTLERRKKLGDCFLREITAKGKALYARTHA